MWQILRCSRAGGDCRAPRHAMADSLGRQLSDEGKAMINDALAGEAADVAPLPPTPLPSTEFVRVCARVRPLTPSERARHGGASDTKRADEY